MYTCNRLAVSIGLFALCVALFTTAALAGSAYQGPFGFGTVPSAGDIRAVDIAIGPNGEGLPPGSGTVTEGAAVFQAKCVVCHGPTGTEGPGPRLVGGKLPVKTIGSYWPYATTIFDYIRRAQPVNKPGSLTAPEVYALTAWLLHQNNIIGTDTEMNAKTLPQVQMPNRNGFRPDPRPDVR